MQIIGLLTEDPRTYYEVLETLREQGLKFVSLDFGDTIPANVGVVITTEQEKDRVDFDRIVVEGDPDSAVMKAKRILAGENAASELMIGIDPGVRPGFAALGDG